MYMKSAVGYRSVKSREKNCGGKKLENFLGQYLLCTFLDIWTTTICSLHIVTQRNANGCAVRKLIYRNVLALQVITAYCATAYNVLSISGECSCRCRIASYTSLASHSTLSEVNTTMTPLGSQSLDWRSPTLSTARSSTVPHPSAATHWPQVTPNRLARPFIRALPIQTLVQRPVSPNQQVLLHFLVPYFVDECAGGLRLNINPLTPNDI
jgi:hypothetical protein